MEAEKWGRRIRAFRKLKGYTQEGLAEVTGISVSVLGEIERGTRMPSDHALQVIAETLEITVKELAPKTPKK